MRSEAEPRHGPGAMASRIAASAVLACLAAALLCSTALGDADPASDILLGENVFYPYNPPVSSALQSRLNGVVAAAHKARLPLKVALIATPIDLGAIPSFYDKPAQYAAFLDQEISFGRRPPLLVVMPTGYGAAGLNRSATAAVGQLSKPAAASGDALAQAAVSAVSRIAAASGHPVGPSTTEPGGAGGGGSGSVLVPAIVLAAVCIILAGGIIAWRRRGPVAPSDRRVRSSDRRR
jgi:hypothetical protein